MSHSKVHNWLLCYDIADPRRLARVHRHMKKHGWALQYSVFQLQASQQQLDRLIDELDRLIDPKADDIRIYPLHTNPRRVIIGQRPFDTGIMFFNNQCDLFAE